MYFICVCVYICAHTFASMYKTNASHKQTVPTVRRDAKSLAYFLEILRPWKPTLSIPQYESCVSSVRRRACLSFPVFFPCYILYLLQYRGKKWLCTSELDLCTRLLRADQEDWHRITPNAFLDTHTCTADWPIFRRGRSTDRQSVDLGSSLCLSLQKHTETFLSAVQLRRHEDQDRPLLPRFLCQYREGICPWWWLNNTGFLHLCQCQTISIQPL